jgi:hypothetical protein
VNKKRRDMKAYGSRGKKVRNSTYTMAEKRQSSTAVATEPLLSQDAPTAALQEAKDSASSSRDQNRKANAQPLLRLTKYEKAVLISTRIEELEANARPLVAAHKSESFFDIATREYSACTLGHLTALRTGT